MGNPTAAQEPSMEEILASIRQIISEDGDASEAQGEADETEQNPEQVEAASQDDDASDEGSSPEAAATENEEDDDADEDDGFDLSADAEPALAEISKEIEAESSRLDEPTADLETMKPAEEADQPEDDDLVSTGPYENPFDTFRAATDDDKTDDESTGTDQASEETDQASEEEATEQEQMPADLPGEREQPDDESTPVAMETMSIGQIEPELPEPNETPSEMSESQTMTATAPAPAEYSGDDKLISADAGASVANAFSTLTHTILSQNARTLDDLVSDMLQPMLKEWLDENLPTLVERLVKQEIDRMARGGRA